MLHAGGYWGWGINETKGEEKNKKRKEKKANVLMRLNSPNCVGDEGCEMWEI